MTLIETQQTFTILIARLIDAAYRMGYKATVGEAYRPQAMALFYALKGAGIKNSLHTQRLAMDLNLFKDGKFLTTKEEYEEMGKYWESLSTPGLECAWGGRFTRVDADHFSIAFGGRK